MRETFLKRKSSFTLLIIGLLLFAVVGCSSSSASEGTEEATTDETQQTTEEKSQKPILIQAPMPIEGEKLVEKLENVTEETSGNFVFWIGTLEDYPVIVAKTGKGMENTAAATMLAIEKYDPIAIINQGTSGGHDPSLNVFDIVLGERTVNIGALKTPTKEEGEGIVPTEWIPMDLMASEGSAGEDPNAEKARYFEGDENLLAAAKAVKDTYTKGKVVEGTIGSADFWNNEVDRINWFHTNFGTSVEEMEAASAAQIAGAYEVPFLGIRVLSNNKTNDGEYNPNTAAANQGYVYEVVKEYISTLTNEK
ncbi:5'-methylthioadenosine/S-adenosylhomocysteine nucleosidase [Mesobacillus maritimus]|uniref:5'-methylthioadenosine/S-adenosylhomocysteine nucleosidase n=1 Tax=Mesobacillus maritimus TaxID=1643336 RepID=UPI00203C8147|nr:5'-methylthioadenosine/S-adenosylhomocysteine nucleosidase [Mesobacillus maritimus]MCM3588299.1 5'-methylthioadenosine/S-adenosylhomocysteine nucleosidase [Mesobacillus maritimus]